MNIHKLMAKLEIKINTIFDGIQPSALFGQDDEFLESIGIDPDMPRTDGSTDLKTGGIIRPVNYEKFSGDKLKFYPIAIITTPKTSNVYVVTRTGFLIRYDSALENEVILARVAGGGHGAEGAFYYNNYIYICTPGDVSRYGPLDGTPTSINNVWTGATLGSQTALVNNDYPESLLSTQYLKHYGVTHVDGAAYFLDFKDGIGYVHQIQTKKTTVEGDTNDGSDYGILDLPPNYLPISITSYGNDLVVSASLTNKNAIQQGKAALFFFNPADTIPSFYNIVQLPDSICSGLIYENGFLYGMSGDLNGGYRLFQYVGGDTIQTLKYLEDGNCPLQGAVDGIANKIIWAADTTIPMTSSGLWGYGSKSDLFPRGLHNVGISPFT